MVRILSASYSSASSSRGEEDEVAVSLFLRPNISSSEESESESSSSELLTATTLPSSTTFCVELGRFAKDNGCCDGPGDFTSLIRLCAGEPLYCADRREEKLATGSWRALGLGLLMGILTEPPESGPIGDQQGEEVTFLRREPDGGVCKLVDFG